MNTIFNLIEGFEKLAYRILLWFIFIPKTLIQITIHPDWASDYIKGELKQEKSPFDEYMSPVVLLLTVALIPAILLHFIPSYQVTITRVEQEETAAQEGTIESWLKQNNPVAKNSGDGFEATADFASSSTRMKYEFEWYVEEVQFDDQGYTTGYSEMEGTRESHSEINGTADSIETLDNNTASDRFYFRFPRPGGYYINVQVWKIDPDNNLPLETYTDYVYVFVPDTNNPDLKGLVSESRSKRPSASSRQALLDALTNELKSETTVFLALAMLLPPLLFALASRIVTGREISENSLREVFYEECYYFAPVSLAGWASLYAVRFFTSDIFYYFDTAILIVGLPVVLALIWFMSVEVRAIVREGEGKISSRKAFLIVVVCLALIGTVIAIILFLRDAQGQDFLRRNIIRLYILGAVGLLMWYLWGWNKERRKENRKLSAANLIVLGTSAFVLLCTLVGILLLPASPRIAPTPAPTFTALSEQSATATSNATPTLADLQATPTDTTADSNRFYTEAFDGNLDAWASFMTSGVESQVHSSLVDGKLTFQLSPYQDKIPWYYLINTAFEYTDARVDAIVNNTGNNANGASLICRLSENGWYEFWVSNAGFYAIYAFDGAGNSYHELFSGGSSAIKAGHETNQYTAVCKGNELTLYVNDTPVKSITDTTFNFTEGNIGIAVSSPQTLPVDLQFDSLTVSQP